MARFSLLAKQLESAIVRSWVSHATSAFAKILTTISILRKLDIESIPPHANGMVAIFDKRCWLAAALGPIFLLLSAALCDGYAYLFLALVSLPLTLLLRWRGYFASLALFLVPPLITPLPPHVAGLSIAMALALWIAMRGSEFLTLKQEESKVDETAPWRKRVEELEEAHRNEEQLRHLAQGNLERLEQGRIEDTMRLLRAKEEVDRLSTPPDERPRERLAQRLCAAREVILYLKRYRDRYRQLREQFVQKQEELDHTRRDLFLLQEELEKRAREEEEAPNEVAELQELVGSLLEELSSRTCLDLSQDFAALMSH